MDDVKPLRWLYLDLNSYFASVEQQLDPALRGRPVVVAAANTDATSAIAASYEAKAFGIKTGTPIWKARVMCRDLVVVSAQHEHYVRYHHLVIAEIERHVPVTAVCSIDEVACRLLDNENGIAQVTALSARIKAGLAANVGAFIKASIGVAPNRFLAKIAADMMKPDGLTILPQAELAERLCTLKPGDIPGVGRNMEKRLAAAGIVDVARILALDPQSARTVWGSVWGERLHWLLRGHDLPEIPTETRSIGHSHVLAPNLRPPDAARLVARRLLVKAATRLRRMNFTCNALVLTVRAEVIDGVRPKWSVERKLAACEDNFTLLAALDALWVQMRPALAVPRYLQVAVTLLGLKPASALQLGLFDKAAQTEVRRQALSRAMDRVNSRFGRDAVTIGHDARGGTRSKGPAIAFTRIPQIEEFDE
jgi:DNA polymerase-4